MSYLIRLVKAPNNKGIEPLCKDLFRSYGIRVDAQKEDPLGTFYAVSNQDQVTHNPLKELTRKLDSVDKELGTYGGIERLQSFTVPTQAQRKIEAYKP